MISKEDIIKFILEHRPALADKNLTKFDLTYLVIIKTQLEIDLQKCKTNEVLNSNDKR